MAFDYAAADRSASGLLLIATRVVDRAPARVRGFFFVAEFADAVASARPAGCSLHLIAPPPRARKGVGELGDTPEPRRKRNQ